MNHISLINKSNPGSSSDSKKPKGNSGSGGQIEISQKHMPSEEMEVTHEVFLGENLKRVIRALCGK